MLTMTEMAAVQNGATTKVEIIRDKKLRLYRTLLREVQSSALMLMAARMIGGARIDIHPIPDGKCKCGEAIKVCRIYCELAFSRPLHVYILSRYCEECRK